MYCKVLYTLLSQTNISGNAYGYEDEDGKVIQTVFGHSVSLIFMITIWRHYFVCQRVAFNRKEGDGLIIGKRN